MKYSVPLSRYCNTIVMYGCEAWAGCATAFEIKSLSVAFSTSENQTDNFVRELFSAAAAVD